MILKEIRKSCIKKRACYSEEARFSLSQKVCEHLSNWLLAQNKLNFHVNILLFYPFKNELDVFQLLNNPKLRFCKFFLPKIDPIESGRMSFFLVESSDLKKLSLNKYGIPEPREDATEWSPSLVVSTSAPSRSVVLVPALRISKDGYRLGYGGGYYDRFLKKFGNKLLSFGICYADEHTPHTDWQIQDHDQILNFTVTPNGLFKNVPIK